MQNPTGSLLLAVEDAFTRHAILGGAIQRHLQVFEVDEDFGLSVVIFEKLVDVIIVEASHSSVDAIRTAELANNLKRAVKPLTYLLCDSLSPFLKIRALQAGVAGIFMRSVDDGQVSINADQILDEVLGRTSVPNQGPIKVYG